MDKSNTTLLVEARTILYVLHSIAAGSRNWNEDICREDMVRLLYMARMRLDAMGGSD